MSDTSSLIERDKVKTIRVAGFQLQGYLLKMWDVIIKVDNISMVTASKLPMPAFPTSSIFCFLGGMIVWAFQEMQGRYYGTSMLSYVAFALFLAGVWKIVIWVREILDRSGCKNLNIFMNSGYTYSIVFKSESFLRNVLDTLEKLFERGIDENTSYFFNIQDCRIEGGSIVNSGTIRNN